MSVRGAIFLFLVAGFVVVKASTAEERTERLERRLNELERELDKYRRLVAEVWIRNDWSFFSYI